MHTHSLSKVLLVTALMALPAAAAARDVEPGAIIAGAGLGAGIRLGGGVQGSSVFAMHAQGEYALNKMLGIAADVQLGLGSAVPLRLHVGGKVRLAELDWPILPYGLLQLSVGQLFGAVGADLWLLGARLGVGGDYALTAAWGVGLLVAGDLDSTLGPRPAFYGTLDLQAYATYTF